MVSLQLGQQKKTEKCNLLQEYEPDIVSCGYYAETQRGNGN